MRDMGAVPMVRLTTVSGAFAAHVLAARLDDEGFDVQLRGALHSPYPLAVGGFNDVDVFVPEDQVDEASYVLLVTEIDNALDEEPEEHRRRIAHRIQWRWRAVAACVLAVALWPAVRVLHVATVTTPSAAVPALRF